jgi:hypothetical protein
MPVLDVADRAEATATMPGCDRCRDAVRHHQRWLRIRRAEQLTGRAHLRRQRRVLPQLAHVDVHGRRHQAEVSADAASEVAREDQSRHS